MKKQSEIKSHSTSLRMTQEQFEAIEKYANTKQMSVSSYILSSALHADSKLTPAIMVGIQELVNHTFEAVKHNAPEQAFSLQEEAAALWSKLS